MNKSILHILMLIVLITAFACDRNKTEISGLVLGGGDSSLSLERLDVNRTSVIDSVKVKKDGSFSLKTQQEEPELFVLKNQKGDIINLLLSPGEKVTIETEHTSFGKNYSIKGSEESEGIQLLVSHLHRTRTDLDSLLTVADAIEDPESPQLDLLRNAYAQTIIKQKRFTIRYLVENMHSLSSVYALYQKYDEETLILAGDADLQYFKTVADSLETVYPNSSLTQSLRNDINRREAAYKEASQLNTLLDMADEASGLLDLSIPDRDGKERSLTGLKGKVVLLTFWASGDQTSIQTMLQLKSTYKKYHSLGFEIYAVSLDNNKVNWMKAIDFNEFEWINVSELSFPESRASLLYNVSGIPTSFLITRESDIVAKNIYGRNLETWLDNLI